MAPRLTIAMPAFNEEAGIESAVREALGALDALPGEGEVLVVDDGSTDSTPAILDRLRAGDPRLRVVRHDENLGIGAYSRTIMAESAGDWVFFTGADGEWDPRNALRFLDIAREQDADAVLGHRTSKRYGPWRRLVSFAFNALVLVLFFRRFRDIGSIRLLRRSVFAPLPLRSRSAFINAERLLVAARGGARIVEVPVEHRARLAGKGRGARPSRVAAAFGDLIMTRLRWRSLGTRHP